MIKPITVKTKAGNTIKVTLAGGTSEKVQVAIYKSPDEGIFLVLTEEEARHLVAALTKKVAELDA